MMGRFTTGLVIVALLLPPTAHATTAVSLSDRIQIDGNLDEYASDEWMPEHPNDSEWGLANELYRFAVTWDRDFLYLGVHGATFDSFFALFVSNRAGGLRTLEDAGDFRRAIELPGAPINLIALAQPQRNPEIARVDDTHPFALVDRSVIPAAVAGTRTGPAGFEMAVPWSVLAISEPVQLVAAITGDVGTGAGDTAPGASVRASADRFARAVLDRLLVIDADADHDGLADVGVSPDSVATTSAGVQPASEREDASVSIDVSPRTIAPDQGESAAFSYRTDATSPVFVSGAVYSMNGDRVRVLFSDDMRTAANGTLAAGPGDAWDGRDAQGDIVRGGAYVVVVEWGFARGERADRARAAVVVVR